MCTTRAAYLWLFLSSSLFAASLAEERCSGGECPCELGATCYFTANASSTVYVAYQLNQTTENEAIRVLVSSREAGSDHPLLVTVRQPRDITSWVLPYVESGHSYHTVERTLCPLNNRDDDPDTARLLIDVSTSSADTVNFTLSTSIVSNFNLQLNTPVNITASPSKPAYLQFSYPPSTTKVKVRFSSSGSSSDICAIASIQTTYCPVVELLDNPDHRGTFQTMRSTAAINTRLTGQQRSNSSGARPGSYGFFYAVVTVFPSNEDHSACYSSSRSANDHLITSSIGGSSDTSSNLFVEPVLGEEDREKVVTITVVPALSDSGYAVAIVTATVVYMVFYFIALVWIFFSDYICYQKNSFFQFISRELINRSDTVSPYEPGEVGDGEMEGSGDDVEGEDEVDGGQIGEAYHHGNNDRYGSPEPLTANHDEEPDGKGSPLKRVVPPRQRYSSKMSTVSEVPEEPLKRPSLWNVLAGSHLSVALTEVQLHGHSVHPSPVLHRRPHPQQRVVRRHTSRSESNATYGSPESSLNVTQSLKTSASSGVRSFESSMKKAKSLDTQQPFGEDDVDYIDGEPLSDDTLNEEEHSFHGNMEMGMGGGGGTGHVAFRTRSYLNAINLDGDFVDRETAVGESLTLEERVTGRCYRCDTDCLPVNLYISEIDIDSSDEAAVSQNDYHHLYWYMITLIIFYGIPAFQLVITYQQLVNVSGNEDLCYYNSLCSHPWRVSNSLTLSSLNNIISNIGYFVLGFLFILIAYRRRTIYRAFEEVNRELAREKRMGVPQYFGIYYAIGLALIAEAFMSAAYHICPSNANYQYDTTFMFVLGGLGLFKLLESRSPDHNPPLYKILFLQAAIIVLAVVGVLYSTALWFYILFFFVHMATTFFVTMEIYYRWQISVRKSIVDIFKLLKNCKTHHTTHDIESHGGEREREEGERDENSPLDQPEEHQLSLPRHKRQYSIMELFKMYRKEGLCPPKHKPKFFMALLSNVVNLGFGLYLVGVRPLDFGTYFLTILITNFLLYLFFYAITKCVYKERPSFRPIIFFFFSVIFWLVGVYSYWQAATDWLQPPAISRDGNRECIILNFFDSHDLWHFTSAFGLFFSFVMLMTLDDNQDGTTRDKLRVF